jgi:hypothetical protein
LGIYLSKKKRGRINYLIWLATSWNIWKHRNNVIFSGITPNASTLLEDIKTFHGCCLVGGMPEILVFLSLIGVMIPWVLFLTPNICSYIVRDWVPLILPYNKLYL